MIKIALAGNPNCGKTSLFNVLTGSDQYVGNWPGVTVEKKEGLLKGHDDVTFTDLPGIYSLSPYTPEEIVARNYLIDEKPDAILDIIDGTNIERNLYLTTQLCETGIPVLIAINMMDLVRKRGDEINKSKLQSCFGCPVVEISALKGTGITAATERVVDLAKSKKAFEVAHFFDEDVEIAINKISSKLPANINPSQKRYYATKIFEKDEKTVEQFDDLSQFNDLISQTEKKFGDDSESIIVDQRYKYISSVINQCVVRENHKKTPTDIIDSVVMNRFLALPIFAVVMTFVYYVSISLIGNPASQFITENVFGNQGFVFLGISKILTDINCADWLTSLICDGIIGGVGSVLSFAPQLFVLFLFLSFLEDCGYMSRIAFILDKLFRKFGLSGKSFIPILVGTGCGVPGIMASRTIENEKDRKMTIITTTFIPCGAKIPVISLISTAIFGGAWWIAPFSYLIGICAILVSGLILKKTKPFKSKGTPFVMELPEYHLPKASNVLKSMWDRGSDFLKKAGTIIFVASIVIWFLSNCGIYNGSFGLVSDMNNSVLAYVGKYIAFVFKPLGFGFWQGAVATAMGLLAKEGIVSVLGVLCGDISSYFTTASGLSFLVFNLLCAPCIAAVSAIHREMKSIKWFLFAIVYQTVFAYTVAFIINNIGLIATGKSFGISTIFAAILCFAIIFMAFFRKNKKSVAM